MWRNQGNKGCSLRSKGYLIIEAFIVLAWIGVIVGLNSTGKRTHLGFFCEDLSIRYPYKPSTVSDQLNLSFTIGIPIFMIVMVDLVSYVRSCKSFDRGQQCPALWTVVRAVLTYFYGFMMLTGVVVVIKLSTGRLRPHFLAVCKPNVNLTVCRGYVSDYTCTNTEDAKLLTSARESFPSGHAANAVYMALFMVFFIEKRTNIRSMTVWKMSIYATLTIYAVWCGMSRVTDHMHHVGDVITGSLLGVLSAATTFYGGIVSIYSLQTVGCSSNHDVEEGRLNVTANDNNNNKNDDDDDSDDSNKDEDNLEHLETETPSTPTPLLFNGLAISSTSGLRIGPLRLEGDKRKFSRRATLQ